MDGLFYQIDGGTFRAKRSWFEKDYLPEQSMQVGLDDTVRSDIGLP